MKKNILMCAGAVILSSLAAIGVKKGLEAMRKDEEIIES